MYFYGRKELIKGVKFYLKNFDGKAATCEDFLKSSRNLNQI